MSRQPKRSARWSASAPRPDRPRPVPWTHRQGLRHAPAPARFVGCTMPSNGMRDRPCVGRPGLAYRQAIVPPWAPLCGLCQKNTRRTVDRCPSARAWSRSAINSSQSSRPIDRRSRESLTRTGVHAVVQWVIRAGCSISDSTLPSDTARVNTRVRSHTRPAVSASPRNSSDTTPPKPSGICLAASRWSGWPGSPG